MKRAKEATTDMKEAPGAAGVAARIDHPGSRSPKSIRGKGER
jgi:hypothetical protein